MKISNPLIAAVLLSTLQTCKQKATVSSSLRGISKADTRVQALALPAPDNPQSASTLLPAILPSLNPSNVQLSQNDGPFSASCKDVAAFVYRGEGTNDPRLDILSQCRKTKGLAFSLVPGQAFSPDRR